jgi:hypothetical protein
MEAALSSVTEFPALQPEVITHQDIQKLNGQYRTVCRLYSIYVQNVTALRSRMDSGVPCDAPDSLMRLCGSLDTSPIAVNCQ